MVQVIHEVDVVESIRLVLKPGVRGDVDEARSHIPSVSHTLQRNERSLSVIHGQLVLRRMCGSHLTRSSPPELDPIHLLAEGI